MRRARRHGVRICVATWVLALAFVYGLWQKSYWAVAIPVSVAVLSALWLMFWIGYTISTVEGIPEEAEHYSGGRARHIARGICLCSLILGVVFVVGVARRSYWTLAIPVAGGVLSLLGMIFWIGRAIITQKTSLPAIEPGAKQPPAGDGSV